MRLELSSAKMIEIYLQIHNCDEKGRHAIPINHKIKIILATEN
jgi:hypothetical protein